jgi:hypothetical protein
MAERPARPAVLTAGWRSRPGVVRLAAVLLGLFGPLIMLVEADEGQLGVEVVVTGLVLLVTAAWVQHHGGPPGDPRPRTPRHGTRP